MDNQKTTSNLNMDYDNNKRFFDPANAKAVKKIVIASVPFFVIAAILWILFGWWGGTFSLIALVIGGGLMFFALSKNVKESEVTQYLHPARKEVRTLCGEALGYPSDLENESLLFMGAVTGDKLPEGAYPARKLKDGRMLTQELLFTYVYVRKQGLYVFTRVFSLVEDKIVDETHEFDFNDFDKVSIEPVGMGNKANLFKIALGNKVLFEAPLFGNDYAQDEFLSNLMHTRERALKG